jgi:hypothetical protein
MASKKKKDVTEKTVSVVVNGSQYNLSLVNGKAKMTRWND